jgi:Fic family protein
MALFQAPELDSGEMAVLGRIDEVREQLQSRLLLSHPRRWVGSLRRLSFARAIQGSNSIEGYEARLDDADAVAMHEEPIDAQKETALALAGYRDAMTYVLQIAGDENFVFSPQLLKSLHFMMTGYSLKNRPGSWRAGPVYVRQEATGQVVHEGPDAALVPGLVGELVEFLGESTPVDPLVAAATAHLNLVMIHPYRDGNGRMARCLQSLVLARNGIASPVFMSIEEYLGRNTQAYYDVMSRVGGGTWSPGNDTRQWVRFVLTAHLRQAHTQVRRVRESEQLWTALEETADRFSLPPRVVTAMFDAASGLRVRNSTYRAALAQEGEEITDQTAGRDLRSLVDKDLLTARGVNRGRHYVAGREPARIRAAIVAARDPRDDTDPFEPSATTT